MLADAGENFRGFYFLALGLTYERKVYIILKRKTFDDSESPAILSHCGWPQEKDKLSDVQQLTWKDLEKSKGMWEKNVVFLHN